ncbi:hypothetical protein EV401DRAFT_2026914 [Pisolithus croceorrhizus]|nr:hypothetical protein EV401DRAFT_2026914 [Pisolithus croceorrhizus]
MGIPGGFGSTLIGGLISAIPVLHLLVMQTYVYYMHYSDDASAIRVLVTVVCISCPPVNACLTCRVVCHFLYYYLVTNYGIPTSLLYMVWSLPVRIPKSLTGVDMTIFPC